MDDLELIDEKEGMNDWSRYEIHVLKTLDRLEKKLDRMDSTIREHAISEETRIGRQEKKLVQLERELKWHNKMFSTGAAVFATVVSWLLGLKHSS